MSAPAPIETDAVVIGAGPVGLFQVFQLGLLEIKAHVIDALPYAGGQCIELYPDKPIYDIPAVPATTGRELVASLMRQAAPFEPVFHLGEEVASLARQADGRFLLGTSRGKTFLSKTVFIAAGVGAFQPRRLRVDGIATLEGRDLFYHGSPAEDLTGRDVVVVGGDEAALQCALDLASRGLGSVTLLHRRDVLQAGAAALAEMQALCEAGQMAFRVGQIIGFDTRVEAGESRLSAVHVSDVDAQLHVLPADRLLVFQGLSPRLGPVADWGLAMARKQLEVDTERFATSEPGIFAVGDINTYPGKKKLIVCGFHECVLAAFGAVAIVFPERRTLLQYTTTSPRLHQLLGVATPGKA
ncbi:ferredoxin--NADP(+) reductase [Rhodoferax koreense]|uniref:Ferredoxin--NADP reductase n=1 Tax=Rhodoferax koreensis TaxID=1842727 RepID=A0A1P8JXA2_9BURK|nr:NAD(P)/FAD-dependent oxidoreductase [Rhodoferax koreense]APW38368.1 ferredoxin--NADP(+) reductase [Rhodoferax koreense]